MKIKEVLLGILIAIFFLMFCVYGTKLVYDSPSYDDFCDSSYDYALKGTENCSVNIPLQNEAKNCYSDGGIVRYEYDSYGCERGLECDFCNKDFEKANEDYTKNLFLISILIVLVVIVISVIFIRVPTISGGLMAGSLFFVIYGTAGYWEFMIDVMRFIVLGIVLTVLIWLAYYLFYKEFKKNLPKKNSKKKKRK